VEQSLGRCPQGVVFRGQGGKVCFIPLGFQGGKKEAKVVGKLVKYAAIRGKTCALTLGPRSPLVTEKEADMLGKVHGIGTWMAIGLWFRGIPSRLLDRLCELTHRRVYLRRSLEGNIEVNSGV
jgi:hypothetical protein